MQEFSYISYTSGLHTEGGALGFPPPPEFRNMLILYYYYIYTARIIHTQEALRHRLFTENIYLLVYAWQRHICTHVQSKSPVRFLPPPPPRQEKILYATLHVVAKCMYDI